jgi:hypothetical protein
MEAYANAGTLNGSAGNSAPVGGRRRSHKKLRVVKKKTVRRMLKKMGLKMRGGNLADGKEVKAGDLVDDKDATGVAAAPAGGRRRRSMRRRRGGNLDESSAAAAETAGRRRRRGRKFLGLF